MNDSLYYESLDSLRSVQQLCRALTNDGTMKYRQLLMLATHIETRRLNLFKEVSARRARLFSFTSTTPDESNGNSRRPFNPATSFRVTDPPNPNWQLRQGISKDIEPGKSWKAEEETGWRTWNLLDYSPGYVFSRRTSLYKY